MVTLDHIIAPLRELLAEFGEEKVKMILGGYHDCIGSDQEQFLRTEAIMMEKRNMCRSYLAIGKESEIMGYFSIGLRCMKVPGSHENGSDFSKKMNIDPESRVAQSYLIGQLSRSKDAPKGFGIVLLKDAIDMIKDANLIVGCRLVRVDCVDRLIDYYARFGFSNIRKNEAGDLNQMAYILRRWLWAKF